MTLNLAAMGRANLRQKVKGVKGTKSMEEKYWRDEGEGKGRGNSEGSPEQYPQSIETRGHDQNDKVVGQMPADPC